VVNKYKDKLQKEEERVARLNKDKEEYSRMQRELQKEMAIKKSEMEKNLFNNKASI
jgi:hypothetical protein